MEKNTDTFTRVPFPAIRRLMVDGGRMGRQKHTVHGLVEFDVTAPRQIIRQHKARTGETLSFTAFVTACLGQAVAKNKHMQAYRSWRGDLVIFDEVDVNTMFEVEVDGRKIIQPHILRAVNHKTFRDLHSEIRSFQEKHEASREARAIDWFVRLPVLLRRLFYFFLFRSPKVLKEVYGTVILSAVGMFGSGSGWGIPVPTHTLQITLGGICEKPGVVAGGIEIREYMNVTISFDHDLVDGAPAARFTQRLKELIESGYGLPEEQPLANQAAA
jgi:pyruvate/2-oxoglutarate dehydrogenase complex dihydrolipoamide acyltransferase (E2) component